MMLDISFGTIFAAVVPDTVRSRVSGAFQAVNYGTRPVGALLGGLLGAQLGLRPALWIATAGGVTGFVLLLPTRLPAFRMPSANGTAEADGAGSGDVRDAGGDVRDAGGAVRPPVAEGAGPNG
jgi:MFS family permease